MNVYVCFGVGVGVCEVAEFCREIKLAPGGGILGCREPITEAIRQNPNRKTWVVQMAGIRTENGAGASAAFETGPESLIVVL